ncbi:hypothetical protein IC582_024170 [Cucumis melo]
MKVKGKIEEEEIVILIDLGDTHNFIVEMLVKKLSLPLNETPNYGVILSSGTTIKGKGVCGDVEVWLGEWKVTDSFLPLELGGVDVILGRRRSHSLKVIEVDGKNLVFTFQHEGKKVTIRGDSSLTKTRVSLKSIMKSWKADDQSFLVECKAMEGGVSVDEGVDEEPLPTVENAIPAIIDKYADVFEWMGRLPPQRGINHHIYLKKGTDPINVRPYRYAHHQNEEMERLVDKMLTS